MKTIGRVLVILCILLPLMVSGEAMAQPAAPEAITTERVSVSGNEVQGNDISWSASVSADGRYVAFYSDASNLVSKDTNAAPDIFVRDRLTGFTELVSVNSDEIQAFGLSAMPSISADGRYVAFQSSASNLVNGDTNGSWDVFVRDRVAGITERVSVAS